ncbi:MAG: hypothetical protein PF569_01655 [Candidatus Woesearchaeota archaeon]|jgi:hypothetical protein|nr:hypothetical protein [Candidatus Woesearchaeota archaeon]
MELEKEDLIENRQLIEIHVGVDGKNQEIYVVYNKSDNDWYYKLLDLDEGEEKILPVFNDSDQFIFLHKALDEKKYIEVKAYIEESF